MNSVYSVRSISFIIDGEKFLILVEIGRKTQGLQQNHKRLHFNMIKNISNNGGVNVIVHRVLCLVLKTTPLQTGLLVVDTSLPNHHKTNTLAPKKKEITFWSSFPGNVNTTTLFPRSPANPINAPAALSCLSGAPHLFPYLRLSSVVVCRPGIEFDPWTSTLTNCPAPHSLCNCFYAKRS